MSVTLYSFWLSSSAYRVRIALYWKRIPFEYRAVNLGRSAHLDDDYSALNPMKEVPTLIVDGKVLTQSTGSGPSPRRILDRAIMPPVAGRSNH